MEAEAAPSQARLGWLQIWRIALLHPSRANLSLVAADPRASVKRGIVWMAITSSVYWLVGPLTPPITGMVAARAGLDTARQFLIVGAVLAALLGVIYLTLGASISHGIARLSGGAGTFRQLTYCWAVIPPPYVLLIALVGYLPGLLFPTSREFFLSPTGIAVAIAGLVLNIAIILYLAYAQLVAFTAVEAFGVAKGLGILALAALVLAVGWVCLSTGVQWLVISFVQIQ